MQRVPETRDTDSAIEKSSPQRITLQMETGVSADSCTWPMMPNLRFKASPIPSDLEVDFQKVAFLTDVSKERNTPVATKGMVGFTRA